MDDVDQRLTNWGICQRVYHAPNHCESIEHRYVFHREKLTEGEMETRRTPKLLLDHKDAEHVEKAWRRIEKRVRQQLLKLHYVNRAPTGFICRHLKIEQSRDDRHFMQVLRTAQEEIAIHLSKLFDKSHFHAIDSRVNLKPSNDEIYAGGRTSRR